MRRGLVCAALLFTLIAAAEPRADTSASGVRRTLGAALQKQDVEGIRASASLLARMGAGLTEASQAKIAPALGPERAAALRRQFADNVAVIDASTFFSMIQDDHRLAEGLAYDRATDRLFAGTVVDGHLLVREGVLWRRIDLPQGFGGLFGMAFDAKHHRLWIANGIVNEVANSEGAVPGLIEVNGDTLRVVDHKPLPAGAEGSVPGDVALGPDGSVYVSDGAQGGIYRCAPGCTALTTLVPAGSIGSAQGLVISRDRRALIVASYGKGLARVGLADGSIDWLGGAEPMMLDGIDGLVRAGKNLIAVQNGNYPIRLIRIRLNAAENAVAGMDILERKSPASGEATLGVLVGDALVYVATSQWGAVGRGGRPAGDTLPGPTVLRRLPIGR